MAGAASAASRVPLAWRNLTSDRKRLIRSASGIGFAVLLMLIQLGMQRAFMDSALAIVRALDADLILMNPQKIRFGSKATFPRSQLYQAEGDRDVERVSPLYGEWQRSYWKNIETHDLFKMQVLAFDPDKPVFLMPEVNAMSAALKQPDTVLADSRSRRFLGPMSPGAETELGLRKVRIIGTFPLGPDFLVDGTVIMSDRNFLKIFPPSEGGAEPVLSQVEFGLIKLKPGSDAAAVQARLAAIMPPSVIVITKRRLLEIETAYQAGVAPVGPIFNLGTAIGFMVGLLISYQIIYADLSDQLSQYATLKAIGYTDSYLVRVVVEQAVLYGVAGYVPAWLLSNVIFFLVGWVTLLPLGMTLRLAIVTLILTLAMCGISGRIAVRRVLRIDPAEVF